MSTELNFLSGEPAQAEEPRLDADEARLEGDTKDANASIMSPQPETAQPEPAAPAPERGPDGKFVKARLEGDTKDASASIMSPPPGSGHVPLSAMLDEREKRQALERQLADLKARAEPAPPPSRDDQLEAALYAQSLRASRKFAEREYGKETVQTVHEWAAARCDADPIFNQQMRSSDDPYEAAYQAYSREQVLAKVSPGDLDAYLAWKASQEAAPAAPAPRAAPPPRSLANAPGNGVAGAAHIPTGDGEAYGGIFNR